MYELIVFGGGIAGAMAVHRRIGGAPSLIGLAFTMGIIGGLSFGRMLADALAVAFVSQSSMPSFDTVTEQIILAGSCLAAGAVLYGVARYVMKLASAWR